MTESEWLASKDLPAMLDHLGRSNRAGDRKLRLYACACARQVWPWLTDRRSRNAVEVAERFADGLAAIEELVEARAAAHVAAHVAASAAAHVAAHVADWTSQAAAYVAAQASWEVRGDDLRDIVGNPFRPVAISPEWRAPDVTALAWGAYDERLPDGALDPTRLSILADALEDAGCADAEAIGHLRRGAHYRGCWVVDLVLGRQ